MARFLLDNYEAFHLLNPMRAEVVKLVDAVDSKSTELRLMPVRFRPSAPTQSKEKYPKIEHSCSYISNEHQAIIKWSLLSFYIAYIISTTYPVCSLYRPTI